mgnify:CR=1 FL=1|jgi:Na+-translocating ferredoxin:NAD+ oxidoreductase RnfE subunit
MIYARIIVHATVLAVVLNLFNRVVYESNAYIPLVRELLDWLSPGAFVVFSLTLACILNRRPALLTVVFFCSFLALAYHVEDPLSIGVAMLLGAAAAWVIVILADENFQEE